jgi:cupin superfamily acireductone dioxygenase involved in methionine salvage
MNNQSEHEKKALLDDVKESGEIAQAIDKLQKEKVEVIFYVNQTSLDLLESDKSQLEERLLIEKEEETITALKKALEEIAKQYEASSKDVIHALLVPLKYRDKRTVQTFIHEAMLKTNDMNFDLDTRMMMVLQEKKYATVYLALRKKDNKEEKFYTLEEIVDIASTTINNLYDEYNRAFELSEPEIKK